MLRCVIVGMLVMAASSVCVSAEEAPTVDVRVDQISFCRGRGLIAPTCEKPIYPVENVYRIPFHELPTDDDGNRIVWVWSTSVTRVEKKIGYKFTQEATGQSWGESIHVHWIDGGARAFEELLREIKVLLAIIYKPEDFKFVQLSGFTVRKTNRNRWPASFIIEEPGVFHLSVVELGSELRIVPGGEQLTLCID